MRFDDFPLLQHCPGLDTPPLVMYRSGEFTVWCPRCGKLGPTRPDRIEASKAWNFDRENDTRVLPSTSGHSGPSTSLITPT